MKKLTKSQLEAKLRAIQMEDMKEEMMSLEEMKKRALYEYEARQKAERQAQKSSISHKFAVTAIIAICLIGGSFLFSVFAPTVVSSANDFMKRAGIWVNDVLQLGIVVEKPFESADNGLGGAETQAVFTSVEEASYHFDVPLLKLEDDAEEYALVPPIAVLEIKPFYTLSYQYTNNAGDFVSFEYEYITDEVNVKIDGNTSEWTSPFGTMLVWTSMDDVQALYSHYSYILRIKSSLSEAILKVFICQCVFINQP